jgi:DDE superfamily endonuclease
VIAAAISASAPPAPAPATSWCSPTGSSPPWSCCGSSSRTPRWRCSTGWTAQPSPGPPVRSGRCWGPAASPCPATRACGCTAWLMSSPPLPPKASPCRSTAPRSRSTGPGRTAPGGGHSSQVSAAEHQEGRRHHRRQRCHVVDRAFRSGRQHDQTALKTEGIDDLLQRYPQVQALVDAGYRGLAKQFPAQVTARPVQPAKDAPPGLTARWQASRKAQSSQRICVEHANAEHKQWRTLQRYTGRREYYDQTHLAIAGLVSDRAARR